jgi:hypothetical protein
MSITFLQPDEFFCDAGELYPGGSIDLGVTPHGLASGRPAVLLRINVEGKSYVVPTTARLFVSTAKMIEAKYPDVMED